MSQNTAPDEYTRRAADVGVSSIQLTTPNVGLYEGGKWRYEEVDPKGKITYCRYATPTEVMWWETLSATQEQTRVALLLIDEIRAVQTYGLRVAK